MSLGLTSAGRWRWCTSTFWCRWRRTRSGSPRKRRLRRSATPPTSSCRPRWSGRKSFRRSAFASSNVATPNDLSSTACRPSCLGFEARCTQGKSRTFLFHRHCNFSRHCATHRCNGDGTAFNLNSDRGKCGLLQPQCRRSNFPYQLVDWKLFWFQMIHFWKYSCCGQTLLSADDVNDDDDDKNDEYSSHKNVSYQSSTCCSLSFDLLH